MTDSDTYECPVEGCDYGEEDDKTLAQVRGHVTSNGDNDHVWQEVKHELLAEAEKRETTDSDGESEDDGSEGEVEAGDPGEVPGPNGETGHLGDVEEDDDQSDEDDEESTEMATQEEYEEQYSDEDTDPSDGGEGDGDGQAADGDQDDGRGFSVPAVSASTVVLVAGVAVVGLLLWKLYSGGDAASDYEPPEESADSDDSSDGGMAAIEAGTGGVET